MKSRQAIENLDQKLNFFQSDLSFDLKEYQKQLESENLELIGQILSLTPESVMGHRDELVILAEEGIAWNQANLLQLDNIQLRCLLAFAKRRIEMYFK